MLDTKRLTQTISLFLSGTILLAACSGFSSQSTPTVEPPANEEIIPIVSATGVVVPADWATLSLSTSGIVAEVLVAEGDSVTAGQVLLRLKGKEDLQAAITAAKFEVTAAQKALDDLDDAAETAKVQVLNAISSYAKAVRDAQYLLDNFTIPANQADLSPLDALDKMQSALDDARLAFEPYKNKPSGDSTRKDLKEKLDLAQSDYNAAVRRLEYVNALDAARENLDKARADLAVWSKGPDPKDVALAQARLENANAALAAAEAKLEDLELAAKFNGIVTEVDVRLGEWVTFGQPVMQVADLEHLQVETTDLNEIDAARVKIGSPVKITFDALPDVTLQGTVESISPKSSPGSGVNYKVVVQLSEPPSALRWGMTAFVDIEVE
jgi:multidrug resistance efflux pump